MYIMRTKSECKTSDNVGKFPELISFCDNGHKVRETDGKL